MSALRKPAFDLLYTIHDLDAFPEDGLRRELIEGELYLTEQPHWHHQYVCSRLVMELADWDEKTGLGVANLVLHQAENEGCRAGFNPALHPGCALSIHHLQLDGVLAPGVIFSIYDAVAPDVVWVSAERLPQILGENGKLNDAPDLVVEVISPGWQNETRDRDTKLKLYSRRGVREYWIVDWQKKRVEVFRRQRTRLTQIATLLNEDALTSPLLPGFACPVASLFMPTPSPPKV
ncbi:MAG: Uma2 family endonuclease [Acidobacteria bacterium]|nr:Uma2 family endonuclease [Acidobacteriota bacterium]MBI3426376.1 Uma2 family endonuclease [Acidobacteriota bacterium]